MATRNIVPRGAGEGQLGTIAKPWDKVNAITGSFVDYSGSIAGQNLTLVSGSVSSTGSFGRLEVAGNSSFTGNVTIGGNINIGDADTDSITISSDLTSNLIPDADSTYDLGSSTKYWRNQYVDSITATGNISSSASSTGSFGNLNISSNASITGDMVVGGTLTAQEIHTEIESASIIFTSGSTKFGDSSDDNHSFTGSINQSGSFSLNDGNLTVSDNIIIGGTTDLNGNLEVAGNITASLNISASGDILADGRIFEKGTSVIDHATAMSIVFGG